MIEKRQHGGDLYFRRQNLDLPCRLLVCTYILNIVIKGILQRKTKTGIKKSKNSEQCHDKILLYRHQDTTTHQDDGESIMVLKHYY